MKRINLRSITILYAFLLALTPGESFAAEKTFTNSIGMEFVLVPAGSFTMGADKNVEDADDNETPQHRVTLGKPFYLGEYEVTLAQWAAVMGNNPRRFKGRYNPRRFIGWNNPVEQVSWDEVQEFIKRLNKQEGHTRYRLPTEAEWEYAARAGSTGVYSFGDDAGQLEKYAWYGEDSRWGGSTHPVGQKQPNAWGLYDMYGNVWEWVQDWYGKEYYSNSPGTDPKGPSSGSSRVLRGGSWYDIAKYCRPAYRISFTPGIRRSDIGFRLALSPE